MIIATVIVFLCDVRRFRTPCLLLEPQRRRLLGGQRYSPLTPFPVLCNLSAEMQSPHSACYCDSPPQVKTCLFALPFALTDSRLLVADR